MELVENAFLADLAWRDASSAEGLARLQADVALRISPHVAERLVGRRLGMSHCRVDARSGAEGLPQAVTPIADLIRAAP